MFMFGEMKRTLLTAVFTFFSVLALQVDAQSLRLFEDFGSGYPLGKLVWEGDTADYEANATQQLHLLSQGSGISVTCTPFHANNRMRWRTWAKLSFNSSAANFGTLLLFTDSAGERQASLQLGGADDRLRLLTSDSTLILGTQALLSQSVNALWIEVLYLEGQWLVRSSADGLQWNNEGQCYHALQPGPGYTGFACTYTSSNSNRFYFDDFLFEPLWPDTLPPKVLSWAMPSANILSLHFNEALDSSSVGPSAVRVNGIPSDVLIFPNEYTLLAHFNLPLPECNYLEIDLQGVTDTSGNWALDTSFHVFRCEVAYADVQISELMPDPSPPLSLPDAEYLELFNRTSFPINLRGWSLQTGKGQQTIQDLVIDSAAFLLLVKEPDSIWGQGINFGNLSSLSLPNDGAVLVLRDSIGRIIHQLSYGPEIFTTSLKREGGWSIERCDPGNNSENGNWAESKDIQGGSPGRINSCRKSISDLQGPRLIHAEVPDPWSIELIFDESLDSSSIPQKSSFLLSSFGSPSSLELLRPAYQIIRLGFNESFREAEAMQISCTGHVADLNHNPSADPLSRQVALPAQPNAGELIINEVLFDERDGLAEFLEVLNAGQKPIDLSNVMLCSFDSFLGYHSPIALLCSSPHTLFPSEIRYFSKSPDILSEAYAVAGFPLGLKIEAFPSLSNSGGCYSLVRSDGLSLDSMCYNPSWHHKSLSSAKGISLERISAKSSGMQQQNWHSASTLGAGASPGMPNSQAIAGLEFRGELNITPSVISPDLDGLDDYLILTWEQMDADVFMELAVYTMEGRLCASLFSGVCGERGQLTWKGTDDSGNNLPAGHYIVKAVIMDDSGRRAIKKGIGILYR
jgi:hypothetical protein